MNTNYTIIKELQERISLLKTVTERNENDYNSLLGKYAIQIKANEDLRQKMINSANILLRAKLSNSANLIKRNIENVVEILQ